MDEVTQPFGDWLYDQLRRRNWGARDLAARMDTAPQNVYRWVNGERLPDPPSCRSIARALGMDERRVLIAAGHLQSDDPVQYELAAGMQDVQRALDNVVSLKGGLDLRTKKVDVLGRIPADAFRDTQDEGLESVDVLASELRDARAPFGLVVTGECMRSLGMFPGDVVILERDIDRKPRDGELVAISTADGFTFKRWRVIDAHTVHLCDGDGNVAATLHPLMDEYTIEGFYITFKPIAPR